MSRQQALHLAAWAERNMSKLEQLSAMRENRDECGICGNEYDVLKVVSEHWGVARCDQHIADPLGEMELLQLLPGAPDPMALINDKIVNAVAAARAKSSK